MVTREEVNELAMGIYHLSRPYCRTNGSTVMADGEVEIFSSRAVAAMRWGILQVSASVASDCICSVRIYDSRDRLCFSSKQLLRADGTAFSVAFYYKGTDRMSIRILPDARAVIQPGGATVIIHGGKE